MINKEEDILSLSQPNLLRSIEESSKIIDIKALDAIIRIEYSRFKEIDLTEILEDYLKGIPYCLKIEKDKAKIIISPDDNLSLKDKILVPMKTD